VEIGRIRGGVRDHGVEMGWVWVQDQGWRWIGLGIMGWRWVGLGVGFEIRGGDR